MAKIISVALWLKPMPIVSRLNSVTVPLKLTHYQMTNFRQVQIETAADDNLKFDENSTKFSKWIENKMGNVTCNFSFSHSVFKMLVSQGRQKVSLSGNMAILSRCIVCLPD